MKRKLIDYSKEYTALELVEMLSENNAFVFSCLSDRKQFNYDDYEYFELLRDIDDMNMRGDQIMFAIKRYCKNNIRLFAELIITSSPQLVHAVNVFSAKKGIPHKAVEIGGEEEKEVFTDEELEFYKSQELPTYDNFVERVEICDCLTQDQVIGLISENNVYVKGMLQYMKEKLDMDEFMEIITDIDKHNIRGNQLEYMFFEYCDGMFDKLDECLYTSKCTKRMIRAVNIQTAKVDGEYEAVLNRCETILPFPKLREKQKEFYANLPNLSYKTIDQIEALERKKIK